MTEVEKLLLMTKLTQKELAEKVGVAQNQVSRYKLNKPSIPIALLKEWCAILGVDIVKVIQ